MSQGAGSKRKRDEAQQRGAAEHRKEQSQREEHLERIKKLRKKIAKASDSGKREKLARKLADALGQVDSDVAGRGAAATSSAAAAAPAAAAPAAAASAPPPPLVPRSGKGARAQPAAASAPVGSAPAPPRVPAPPTFTYTRQRLPAGGRPALAPTADTAEERARRAERAARFADDLAAAESARSSSGRGVPAGGATASGGGAPAGSGAQGDDGDKDARYLLVDERTGCVRYGTSSALEKQYLRLTSLPRTCDVRPPEVLARALAALKARWMGGCDYEYAWHQLKSMRQDLTVQAVRDALAVDVYETHGRVAVEVGDAAEFRQCLAVLQSLYMEGVEGNAAEFAAYGLLLAAHHGAVVLAAELARMPERLLRHKYVRHALRVVRSYRLGNFHAFFSLYRGAPRMAPYLMDALAPAVRAVGLRALIVAHAPLPLPLAFVATELGFEGAQQAAAYAVSQGAVVDASSEQLGTRASRSSGSGHAAAAAAAAPRVGGRG